MLQVLRQPNFARLWFGGLISMIGDWMLYVGLPIYVYQLSGSTVAASLMFMAQILPRIVLGSVAGVFVDRWDRRRTLVIGNLLLAFVLLPLLLVRSTDLLWLVYAIAFLQSVIRQFTGPAEGALLPNLVGKEYLLRANSLNALNDNLARLIGPSLGGLAAGYLGMHSVALLDALSFLVAAGLISQIRHNPVQEQSIPPACPVGSPWRKVGREWWAGLQVVRRSPTLIALFSWTGITAVGEGLFGVLILVFIAQVVGGGATELGWLMSAQAVGGILGGFFIGRMERKFSQVWLIVFGSISVGVIDIAIINYQLFWPNWWITLPLMMLVGFPVVWLMTGIQSLLQLATSDAYRGRVLGARGAMMALLGLVGTGSAGFLEARWGVVNVLSVQCISYILAGILVWVLLKRRDNVPDADAQTITPSAVSP